MVCGFCAQAISKRLASMPEAENMLVDLSLRVVAVSLRAGREIDDAVLS